MLTREILVANAALSGLSDEQITAITALSQNDENSVIAKKTGEIYGALDADILAVSGIAKNGTEKTYDYAKRVMGEMKTKADGATGLQSQIDSLTKERARLEKAIADGAADAETVKALKQAKADLQNVTTQFTELTTKYEEEKANHEKELFGVRIDNALQTAAPGLNSKQVPGKRNKGYFGAGERKSKRHEPGIYRRRKRRKGFGVQRCKRRNYAQSKQSVEPIHARRVADKRIGNDGSIGAAKTTARRRHKYARRRCGGGGITLDVSGAKTQSEAYELITKQLMAQGKTVGSKEFDEDMRKVWQENSINKLPER